MRKIVKLDAKYENMKFVKMEVKRSSFGRQVNSIISKLFLLLRVSNCIVIQGWIAKPVDETLDLRQLQLNGAFEQLISDLKVLELSGKEIPNFITVKLK